MRDSYLIEVDNSGKRTRLKSFAVHVTKEPLCSAQVLMENPGMGAEARRWLDRVTYAQRQAIGSESIPTMGSTFSGSLSPREHRSKELLVCSNGNFLDLGVPRIITINLIIIFLSVSIVS